MPQYQLDRAPSRLTRLTPLGAKLVLHLLDEGLAIRQVNMILLPDPTRHPATEHRTKPILDEVMNRYLHALL